MLSALSSEKEKCNDKYRDPKVEKLKRKKIYIEDIENSSSEMNFSLVILSKNVDCNLIFFI